MGALRTAVDHGGGVSANMTENGGYGVPRLVLVVAVVHHGQSCGLDVVQGHVQHLHHRGLVESALSSCWSADGGGMMCWCSAVQVPSPQGSRHAGAASYRALAAHHAQRGHRVNLDACKRIEIDQIILFVVTFDLGAKH